MEEPNLVPRTYADLLALAASCPVWQGESLPAAGGATSASPEDQRTDTYTEQQIVEAIKLDVLGKVDYRKVKVFSLYHRKSEIINGLSSMKYEDLLEIAGPPARARVHISGDEVPGTFTMREVKEAIAILAGYRRIGDESELGAGCWSVKNNGGEPCDAVVLVGSHEAAEWNGERVLKRIEHPRYSDKILDFETRGEDWYKFDRLAEYLRFAQDKVFRETAINDAINLFRRWRWRSDAASPVIITGLVLATWVQTVWEWRPQISIIGASNSGKSSLFKALKDIFGPLCKTCSDSTAAGIRQLIQTSARVILFDEFDSEDQEQAKEQQRILKMLRASGRGDAIFRGTSDQKGVEFTLKHIVWLAGIQISSSREADRNRYICQELLTPPKSLHGKLVVPPEEELRDLGQRLLATAIVSIHDAKRMAVRLKDTNIEGVHNRVVESYSVPAAILAVAQGESLDDAREILKEMLADISNEDHAGMGDMESLMSGILGSQVQIGPNRFSVAQLLETVIRQQHGWSDAVTALESRGVKLDTFGQGSDTPPSLRGKDCFVMGYALIGEHLIKNSKWGGQAIDQILKRLPSAVHSRRRVGGQRVQTVAIPLDHLKIEYLGMTEINSGDKQSELPD